MDKDGNFMKITKACPIFPHGLRCVWQTYAGLNTPVRQSFLITAVLFFLSCSRHAYSQDKTPKSQSGPL